MGRRLVWGLAFSLPPGFARRFPGLTAAARCQRRDGFEPAFSPAREGGVGWLHVTGTLIPALTGGADSWRL
jgi:hypothetical protein